mmetsp:Transcript_31/g.51  ORF Transcript_31/g.51 Transcript_31/m.51 type:complete len:215 (+) Transcript_31:51-695(+)
MRPDLRSFVVTMSVQKQIVVDPFCFRQFEKGSGKTPYIEMNVDKFEEEIHARYDESLLKDGYAPFCKHIFLENFANCTSNVLAISTENSHLLRTGYVARTEYELPVLSRWFPAECIGKQPPAKFLDIILYSREQIIKENAATGQSFTSEKDLNSLPPWGIVSIKAQDVDYELPMAPITMMRNALGKEQGGSGVPLDAEKYRASVDFWAKHANIQ